MIKKENGVKPSNNCCGECCWFYCEATDGGGLCIATEWPYRDCGGAACDEFVSREDMRHYQAVLLQFNRWRRDCHFPSIYTMPEQSEISKAIDFACEYLKRYAEKI